MKKTFLLIAIFNASLGVRFKINRLWSLTASKLLLKLGKNRIETLKKEMEYNQCTHVKPQTISVCKNKFDRGYDRSSWEKKSDKRLFC